MPTLFHHVARFLLERFCFKCVLQGRLFKLIQRYQKNLDQNLSRGKTPRCSEARKAKTKTGRQDVKDRNGLCYYRCLKLMSARMRLIYFPQHLTRTLDARQIIALWRRMIFFALRGHLTNRLTNITYIIDSTCFINCHGYATITIFYIYD